MEGFILFSMPYELKENAYGCLKRLAWIQDRLSLTDSICEIGCGTGAMIVLPLAFKGFHISGFDVDDQSIHYGKKLCIQEGISPKLYSEKEFAFSEEKYDVIIVSEVLEHLNDSDYPPFFNLIRSKLKPSGRLLVTVPNGYGWFELEDYVYSKMGLGKLLNKLKITYKLDQFKNFIFQRTDWVNTVLSTLSTTPHLQRFSYKTIQNLLTQHQFKIKSATGSVLFAGPLTDRVFSGFNRILKANNFLGSLFPRIASGFYVECEMI